MTRLRTSDIANIGATISTYEAELIANTGYDLSGIACRAADISEMHFQKRVKVLSIGVIPITSGQGIIIGFCDAVASILSHIGGRVFVTKKPDVLGLAESFQRGADIMMLSDDDRFVALSMHHRQAVDNSIATGRAFAVGLSMMGGNLRDRPVLVIGCGPVGNSATETLIRMGARVTVYDIHRSRCRDLKEAVKTSSKSEIRLADDLDTALYKNPFILDASPAENIIKADHITPKTYISAPGIPLGLSEAAISKISNRLLHDPLHLGVVTMLAMAVKHQPSGVRNRFM